MEMTEGVENCSSEEARALVLEVTEDEYSKCRVSTTKYPKASHLGLTGVEICGELPNDFDLLILRQLEGFDVAVECRSIIGKNNSHGPMLTPKCGSHMYTLRKESHSLRDCCLERKEDVSQLLSQKSEKNAGFLCCKIEKTGIFHFCKTVNPRCPPHLNKKIMLPPPTLYEVEAKSPGQHDNKDLTKEPLSTYEAFWEDSEDLEETEPSCEDPWWKNEGGLAAARRLGLARDSASKVTNEGGKANARPQGLVKDRKSAFDDVKSLWDEIDWTM